MSRPGASAREQNAGTDCHLFRPLGWQPGSYRYVCPQSVGDGQLNMALRRGIEQGVLSGTTPVVRIPGVQR